MVSEALLALACVVVLAGVVRIEVGARVRARALAVRLAEWRRIAEPLGHRVGIEDDGVVIRGTVAGREFRLHGANCLTYGLDTETGLRLEVDAPARLAIAEQGFVGMGEVYGPPRETGDAELDARYRCWADDAGLARLSTRAAQARDLLLAAPPGLEVHQRGPSVLVRLAAPLDRAALEVATGLVGALWPVESCPGGPPPLTPSA